MKIIKYICEATQDILVLNNPEIRLIVGNNINWIVLSGLCNGDIYEISTPQKLKSIFSRFKSLQNNIRTTKISIKWDILNDKNPITDYKTNKYYYARIEINEIDDAESTNKPLAIWYSSEGVEDDERKEFRDLYNKRYSKDDLSNLFGRSKDIINKEWYDAVYNELQNSIRNIKELGFNEYFGGILKDEEGILIGASYHIQNFGEKNKYCFDNNSQSMGDPINIQFEETLFDDWSDFVQTEGIRCNNNTGEYTLPIETASFQELIKTFSFIKSNCVEPKENEVIELHLKVEEYTNDNMPSAYSFYFVRDAERNDRRSIDLFSKYGDIFVRYLMGIKTKITSEALNSRRKAALNSAIAAIMSRNMSHNLGSHFLYYSQQDFSKLSDSLHDMYYDKDKSDKDIFLEKNNLLALFEQIKNSFSYTKGAAKVFEFLQDRMYYLAAITGIDISQSLPVHLKSQILDFLTEESDYRNFYVNNLVRSEQYTEDTLSIKLNCEDLEENIDDMSISLPLGSISIHAIYNIFENFIRNSAKYQWAGRAKPRTLEFTIKVITNDDDSDIRIQIFDNKESANQVNANGVSLLKDLNSKLENIRFLDEDDSLNNDDKGLKEMLLSSFWVNNKHGKSSIGDVIYDFENCLDKNKFLTEYGFIFISKDGNLGIEFHVNRHYYVIKYEVIKEKPYLTSDIVIVPDGGHKDFIYGREVDIKKLFDSTTIGYLKKYVSTSEDTNFTATKYLLAAILNNIGISIDEKYGLCIKGKSETSYYPNKEDLPVIEFTDHLSTRIKEKKCELKEKYEKKPYYDSISGGDYTKLIDRFFDSATQGVPYNRQYKNWSYKYTSVLIKESAITRITIIDERIFNIIQFLKFDSYIEGTSIKGTSLELGFRNIQVLNLKSSVSDHAGLNSVDKYEFNAPNFVGNMFRKGEIRPHFISIHFGIIQQILKNTNKEISKNAVTEVINNILEEIIVANATVGIIAQDFSPTLDVIKRILTTIGCITDVQMPSILTTMTKEYDILNKTTSIDECIGYVRIALSRMKYNQLYKNIRVAIHTGRGSLSKQEKEALDGYPIIPFGSLRTAFLNSKFVLCQLFYNLKYKKQ